MTHWFRFYDEAINHPKILRLSDTLFRAWVTLLCLASKNGGALPPAADIALMLREKPHRVAEWLTQLTAAGLLDNEGGTFRPHNWDGRQFKSDVSTERVKRFRNGKRNAKETAVETAPEQSRTDTEQSRADAGPLETEIGSRFGFRDTGHVRDWIAKGYSETLILDTIAAVVARGSAPITSLAYFDKALSEAHTRREPSPSERVGLVNMDKVIALWVSNGIWSKYAGPEPGLTGCRATPEQLAKHGLLPDGRKMQHEGAS